MKSVLDSIKDRRSVYGISNVSPLGDEELETLVKEVVKNVPSPFNLQSQRVILLLNDEHKKLWSIVLETLRKIVPAEKFADTEAKIGSFAAGYGSVLYLEDTSIIEDAGNKMPDYKENFDLWSVQANGMMQYALWIALEAKGYGASLQHYNPIIDEEVHKTWNIPSNWKLVAQMPFGAPTAANGEKEFMPIDEKMIIYK